MSWPHLLIYYTENDITHGELWPLSNLDTMVLLTLSTSCILLYMEELCSSIGGWMRVVYVGMTDSSEKYYNKFRLFSKNGVRACSRPVSSGDSWVNIDSTHFH